MTFKREAILDAIKRCDDHTQTLANLETILLSDESLHESSEIRFCFSRLKNEYTKLSDKLSEAAAVSKPERLTQEGVDQLLKV